MTTNEAEIKEDANTQERDTTVGDQNATESLQNGREANGDDSLAVVPEPNAVGEFIPDEMRRATLWVDGLSTFGFRDRDGWAEIGFIEPEHSLVEMRIYRKPGCNLVWWSKHDFPHSTKDIIITVNSTKVGQLGTYFCRRDHAVWNSPGDARDLCHMPNLAKWYNRQKLPYSFMASGHLSARLRVHDGLFYTYQMSESEAVISRNGGDYWRGRVGRVLGADIASESREILIIKIDGDFEPVEIPLPGPEQYEIMVRTIPSNTNDHFHHVYDVLQKPIANLARFGLRFEPREPFVLACDDPPVTDLPIDTRGAFFPCQCICGGGD